MRLSVKKVCYVHTMSVKSPSVDVNDGSNADDSIVFDGEHPLDGELHSQTKLEHVWKLLSRLKLRTQCWWQQNDQTLSARAV